MSDVPSFELAIDTLRGLPTSLKALRMSRGVSLRQVASEAGVSFSTLSRIENGEDCTLDSAIAVLRWLVSPPAVAPVIALPDAELDDEPTARVWTCSVCGKRDTWGPGWTWYGSLRQVENTGQPEAVLCSVACRKTHADELRITSDVIERREYA